MKKVRKYVWKRQIRESLDEPWRDDSDGCPSSIYYPSPEGWYVSHPNLFRLNDSEPIPEEAYAVLGGFPTIGYYVRTILQSLDTTSDPVVRVIREYEKIDPNKKILLDDGVAYAICIYEDCGQKVVPARVRDHLREVHGLRHNLVKDIDYTNEKYFRVVVEHGAKAKAGVSVKALRKGKVSSEE